MQTKPIQNIHQAVNFIQSLPISRQKEVIDWINIFQLEIEKETPKPNPNFFELWQQWHNENQEFLDNDNSWADTRDRNDIGREVIFE